MKIKIVLILGLFIFHECNSPELPSKKLRYKLAKLNKKRDEEQKLLISALTVPALLIFVGLIYFGKNFSSILMNKIAK